MALSQLLPEISRNHSPRCSLPVGFLLQDHTWDPCSEVQGIVLQRFRICRCRQLWSAVLIFFFSDSKKRRERRGRCSSNLKEETRNYIKYLNLIYIYIYIIGLYIYIFQIVSSFKDHNSRPNYHFCWVRWRLISLGTSTNRGFLKWGATPESSKNQQVVLKQKLKPMVLGIPYFKKPP